VNGYELRKQRKRDAIKRAATDLFNAYGIKKVSVAEIARKANVNPVTVYNHFHDKSELIRVIVKDLLHAEWAKYRKILENDLPFLKKLQLLVSTKAEWARVNDNSLLGTALAEEQQIGELVASFFEKKVTPRLADFLRDGQRQGAVRKDLSVSSLSLYIEMFTNLLRAHPTLFADKDHLRKSTQEIWSLFLHGLMGDDPS
jgi:AcrR family transcriptional regulator